jgi:hypothetical protein
MVVDLLVEVKVYFCGYSWQGCQTMHPQLFEALERG